jgi:hypothetical protein
MTAIHQSDVDAARIVLKKYKGDIVKAMRGCRSASRKTLALTESDDMKIVKADVRFFNTCLRLAKLSD